MPGVKLCFKKRKEKIYTAKKKELYSQMFSCIFDLIGIESSTIMQGINKSYY